MSFSTMELSVDNARPVELYQVSYNLNNWYYTSGDQDVLFMSKLYRAVACSHGGLEEMASGERSSLDVSFPFDIEFAEIFRIQPPSEVVSLTILTQNFFVPDDYVVMWMGRILNCTWRMPWVELVTESMMSSMQRAGLRRRYSTKCPFPLYGRQCGVLASDHKESTTALAIDSIRVIAEAAIGKADNYYAGGYSTWTNSLNENVEKRMIVSSNGTTGELVLTSIPIGLALYGTMDLYAGCDHSISTCSSKFNNKDNCGAIPYIPRKNPFGGSSLY